MRHGHGKSRLPPFRQPPRHLPTIWLMTDERIPEAALIAAVKRLPRGAGVIVRHRGWPEERRRALFMRIRKARGRALMLLVAGPAGDAARWGADGWHEGARPASMPISAPGRVSRLIHSASAHDMAELRAAVRARADLVFLSPLRPTRSHPDARALGAGRFAALARHAPVPVMALGGVHPRHALLVGRLGASGYGAIDGLVWRTARKAERALRT